MFRNVWGQEVKEHPFESVPALQNDSQRRDRILRFLLGPEIRPGSFLHNFGLFPY